MIDHRPYDIGATAPLRGGWVAVWDGQLTRMVERGEVAMRGDRFTANPDFSQRARVTREPSLTPGEQQLSAEFALIQMLRCCATTIVDAGGSGPIWRLGNPPTDKELLVETLRRIGCRAFLSQAHR
jgi:hypothetical protein